jgi:hypothetical protein
MRYGKRGVRRKGLSHGQATFWDSADNSDKSLKRKRRTALRLRFRLSLEFSAANPISAKVLDLLPAVAMGIQWIIPCAVTASQGLLVFAALRVKPGDPIPCARRARATGG